MSDTDDFVRRLARLNGIATSWRDVWGAERGVGIDTLRALLRGLDVPVDHMSAEELVADAEAHRWPEHLPARICVDMGEPRAIELALPNVASPPRLRWHLIAGSGERHAGEVAPEPAGHDPATGLHLIRWRFVAPNVIGHGEIGRDDTGERAALAVAPPRCFDAFQGRKSWGTVVQLGGLQSPGDGGLGHYEALASLASALGRRGADAIAVSPVHSLFAADAGHFSPYAPSNRQFLNGLLASPQAWLSAGTVPASPSADITGFSLIDWQQALPVRREALRAAWRTFVPAHLFGPDALGDAFHAFRAEGGQALESHARFEALHGHFFGQDPSLWDWRSWPAAWRSPASPTVDAFARDHAEEIGFHVFLQWLASRQLSAAQQAARDAGMTIGLIADLAVGTHPGGSRAWSEPDALLRDLTIGAPPDLLGPLGQDWGLTIFSPSALRRDGYASFLGDLRAAMRFAGGIRLDHIMGLQRLWCVPAGATANDGSYVEMPWRDLMRLVALESHRHRCMVIGEDLGTVPDGFRDELRQRNVLGIQVLWFERQADGGFRPPEHYSDAAIATTSTHDLATLAGWWIGRDIEWRARLGQLLGDESEARAARDRERRALWGLLRARNLVAEDAPPATIDETAAAAIVTLLGQTNAPLVLVPIEDLLLDTEQPNLPGTVSEHPNWCRRAGTADGGFLAAPPATAIIAALNATGRHTP